jgi:hypothetical protein
MDCLYILSKRTCVVHDHCRAELADCRKDAGENVQASSDRGKPRRYAGRGRGARHAAAVELSPLQIHRIEAVKVVEGTWKRAVGLRQEAASRSGWTHGFKCSSQLFANAVPAQHLL